MNRNVTLAVHLKNLRLARGWSIKTAAEQIGVPVSTYRDWEYGNSIRGEPYQKIAEAFGISLEELFGNVTRSEKTELLKAVQEAKAKLDRIFEIARAL